LRPVQQAQSLRLGRLPSCPVQATLEFSRGLELPVLEPL
jgi:hypothetical protein